MREWTGRAVVLVALASAACPACSVHTDNVRAFSASTLATQQALTPILQSGHGSCVRAAEYHMLKEATQAPPEARQLVESDYRQRLETCQAAREVSHQAAVANSAVVAFVQALSKLAADDTVDFQSELEQLAGEVNQLTGSVGGVRIATVAGQEFSTSTSALLSTMVGWATARYRQQRLRVALDETSEHLQHVLVVLQTLVDEVYIQSLYSQEEQNLGELYDIYEREAADDAAELGRLKIEEREREHAVREQIAQAHDYVARAKKLQLAHAQLVKEAGALDKKELILEIHALATNILFVRTPVATVDPIEVPATSHGTSPVTAPSVSDEAAAPVPATPHHPEPTTEGEIHAEDD